MEYYERKGVTITWQIENVKYIREQKIKLYSPVIFVDVMDGTKWKIGVHRLSDSIISLTIKREAEDDGPEEFGLDYEFSVNALDRPTSIQKEINSFKFQKDKACYLVDLNMNEINTDTFIIRCKIYRQRGSISKSGHFFARTRMKTERCIFNGAVQNFKDVSEDEKKILKTVTSSTGERLMTSNLFLFRRYPFRKELVIEFVPIYNQTKRLFYFKLFILDSSGNKTDIGKIEEEFSLLSSVQLPLPEVSKEYLLEKAALYLPKDTLTLHCEIAFCSGIEYEKVERAEYETDSGDDVKQTDFSNAVKFLTSKKELPCDTQLQTASETFPAHTAILSAQSPIFEAMFKTNMKEAIQKCVCIDDVDAETMKRMLVFLYSNTLEELEWKDTMKLYFAADKYQILSLKRKCNIFLKESVDLSNCCVLLFLADMHQDKVLKITAQDYITHNLKHVLYCDQWKDLEKNHPHLAINYFRELCRRNRLL